MSESARILLCRCQYAHAVPPDVIESVRDGLRASKMAFTEVADLCELAARRDPLLRQLSNAGPVKIAACYPRAVKGLFVAAQAPLSVATTEISNMRAQSPAEVLADLRREGITPNLPTVQAEVEAEAVPSSDAQIATPDDQRSGGEPPESTTLPRSSPSLPGQPLETSAGHWLPWFPVIDYDRCTHCMQCLSFCLFGVYGVDAAGHLEVQSSESCKPNCPACARVCPEAAILFPKYKTGPINGEPVNETDLRRETMKIDISALLGGDPYQLLRERSERAKSRFSKERDSTKALQERRRCLAHLVQAGDIPPEVWQSLPSPEEIARRAAEAKARAEAARVRPAEI